ncbi:398_t:CDS:2 [Ambispora leptoticha]|uniref:398_t:CDS:1 n=1 Tax=Ambispora leptoticha TaxID=144679 RepID=A0A9N8VKU6_9GLOM|nr:398_t:CDS:2 [Ambispora leptoticha]
MAFGGSGFSFGNNTQNPNNTQQTSTGFSFGAPQTTGSTGFGFGAQQTQPQTNGGFGTSSGFGSTSSFGNTQNTFGNPAGGMSSSGAGFGSSFGFGGTTNTGFGQPQNTASGSGTAPGAFGGTFGTNTTTTSTGGAFGSGVGGFGASPAPAFGSGAFGSPAKSNPIGFGFGNTQTPQQPPSLSLNTGNAFGGGFGAGQQPQPNTNTQTSNFSFNQPQSSTSKPAFGFGQSGSVNNTFGSGFGLQPSNTFQLGQPSSSATSTFGGQKPTWSFPSSTTATPSLNFPSFSQPSVTSNPFSLTTSGTTTGGLNLGPVEKTPYEKLTELGIAWDLNHHDYKFQFYFYNMVHPKDMKPVGPPTDRSPALWEQAQKNNPDPSCSMVPGLSLGFDGIKKRIEYAQKFSEMSKSKLEELERQIKNMEDKHHMDNLVKIDRCKQKTLEITERMISVMKQLHLKKLKGKPLRPEDERNQAELERIHQKLQRSLQKLDHLNTEVSRMKVQMGSQIPTTQKFNVGDEGQLNSIIEVLADEQHGISQLIRTVQRDSEDVQEANNALLKKLIK